MKFVLKILLFFILIVSCNNQNKNDILNKKEEIKPKVENQTLFTLLNKDETGIDFINYNKESNDLNYFSYEYFYNGGGVAIADFNNDSLLDIVFTANMAPNKMYINKGNLKFQDITKTANINSNEPDWCTGISVVDINNDGFQDIFISRSGWFKGIDTKKLRNLIYINNGDLTFTEKGLDYGFNDLSRSTQSCFFDMDNDGDLDMYLINNPKNFIKIRQNKSNKKITLVDVNNDYSDSDKFYENINGKFIDKTKDYGFENSAFGLGVIASDINNDGWQDLYIANDYSKPDIVYLNQKNGRFKNVSNKMLKHMSKFSMGVDVGDINNDGFLDVFTTEMLAKDNYSKKVNMAPMNPDIYWAYVDNGLHYQDMHNSLQLNNGNGAFREISWQSNVAETDWSWCPLLADFDNDGYKDLFITNGVKRDVFNKDFSKDKKGKDVLKNPKIFKTVLDVLPSSQSYNYVFKNNADLTFTDKSIDWGIKNVSMQSNGAAYGDLDNDGDLDLVINNIEDQAAVYRNNSDKDKNHIAFNLQKGKLIPYGSKITILDKEKFQYFELTNVNGFQSTSTNTMHFGLDKFKKVDSVLIDWAGGKQTLLTNLEINKTHQIDYEDSKFLTYKINKVAPIFKNVTSDIGLNHVHKELEFDDYKREILLPHKQSQEGPFIDIADVNGDGLDDFFVGNGRGYAGVMYIQIKSGKFKKTNTSVFIKDKMAEDLGVLFFDYDNDGDLDLYVASGSNECELDAPEMQDRLYQNDGSGNFIKTVNVIPKLNTSSSCVVTSDFDNDGDLDLFIGGFQVPGKYPQAGTNTLLLNNNGVFKNITTTNADGLENIGMVKDAVFSDVNGDKKLDLIVVGHWMPVSVFINKDSKFVNETKTYNLDSKVGWWNSIEVGDFNKDGFPDFVVGNLGLNSKHKATETEPFKVLAKDFDNNGTHDIALGYYNNYQLYPVRGKQCSSEQIPELNYKIKTYNDFANLTFDQIYGVYDLKDAIQKDVTYFQTSLLINDAGNSFKVNALPNENQLAPTNAFLTIDLNDDDVEDIISVGNFFPVEVETGRYDAHVGTVSLVDKSNKIKTLPNTESGFYTSKDCRDMKKITINNKPHIVVSSNRDQLQFFEILK